MKKLLFVLFLSHSLYLSGWPQMTFYRSYNISAGWMKDVETTIDGGFICFGAPCLQSFFKTDSLGTLEWKTDIYTNNQGSVKAVAQVGDNGFVGLTISTITGLDYFVVDKVSAQGVHQWSNKYGSIGTNYGDLISTSDGGFLMVGGGGYIIRCDFNGNILWQKRYSGSFFNSVCENSSGGFTILGGKSQNLFLVEMDAFGNHLWQWTYSTPQWDLPSQVIESADGGYTITGFSQSFNPNHNNMVVLHTDSTGQLQWSTVYEGGDHTDAHSIIQINDGSYVIAGSFFYPDNRNVQILLMKINPTGAVDWCKTTGSVDGFSQGQGYDDAFSLIYDTPISMTLAGFADGIILARLDLNGDGFCYYDSLDITSTNAFFVDIIDAQIPTVASIVADTISNFSSPYPNIEKIYCMGYSGVKTHSTPKQELILYPNPTEGKFRVESLKFGVEEIQIYDLFGRLVLSSNEPEIDMSTYPAGLYIWSVGEARGKVVIE